MKTTIIRLEHTHRTGDVTGGQIRYCLRCGAIPGSEKHKSGCVSITLPADEVDTVGPALLEQTGHDTLKFCRDLWWWFHEADSSAGLRSSMGGQMDALELGVEIHDGKNEPDILLGAARKLRRMHAMLRLISEFEYGVLRTWYTERRAKLSEVAVAGAHRSFYEIRGRK